MLVAMMEQRIQTMSGIRTRAERTVTGAVTVCLLFDGWIVQAQTSPDILKTVGMSVTLAIVWVSALLYLRCLYHSFQSQHGVLVKVEDSIGLYSPSESHPQGAAILDKRFRELKGPREFRVLRNLLLVIGPLSNVVIAAVPYLGG